MYNWTAPEYWTDDWLLRQVESSSIEELCRRILGVYVATRMQNDWLTCNELLYTLNISLEHEKPVLVTAELLMVKRLLTKLGTNVFSKMPAPNGELCYTNAFKELVIRVSLLCFLEDKHMLLGYYQCAVKATGGAAVFHEFEERLKEDDFFEYWDRHCRTEAISK